MAGRRRRLSDGTQQYGGYSEAQLDAALLRTQRSDPVSVAIRLATLVLAYALLAGAVRAGLDGPYLVLPLLLELLAVFWIGQLLARVVDCRTFRQSAGRLAPTVIWTVLFVLPIAALLAWDPETSTLQPARLPRAFADAWVTAIAHGLHWALLALLVGLAIGTAYDLRHWRQHGGVFVWTAITTSGFRIAVLLLAAMVVGIPLAVFSDALRALIDNLDGWPLLQANGWAWPVWAALLLLDLGALLLATLIHRDLKAQADERPAQRSSRLPG